MRSIVFQFCARYCFLMDFIYIHTYVFLKHLCTNNMYFKECIYIYISKSSTDFRAMSPLLTTGQFQQSMHFWEKLKEVIMGFHYKLEVCIRCSPTPLLSSHGGKGPEDA